MPKRASFFELLTEAVRYFSENGYVSEIELQNWVKRLRASAEGSMKSDAQVEAEVRRSLMATFTRLSRFPSLKRVNPEVSVFAADRLRPAMRAEMKRRIMASARLIKLNKAQAHAHFGLDKVDGVTAEIEKAATDIENFANQVTNGPPA